LGDLKCFCGGLCIVCRGCIKSPPIGLAGQRVCSHWVGWTCGHLVWGGFGEVSGAVPDAGFGAKGEAIFILPRG
jgi:hypothetical protein